MRIVFQLENIAFNSMFYYNNIRLYTDIHLRGFKKEQKHQ